MSPCGRPSDVAFIARPDELAVSEMTNSISCNPALHGRKPNAFIRTTIKRICPHEALHLLALRFRSYHRDPRTRRQGAAPGDLLFRRLGHRADRGIDCAVHRTDCCADRRRRGRFARRHLRQYAGTDHRAGCSQGRLSGHGSRFDHRRHPRKPTFGFGHRILSRRDPPPGPEIQSGCRTRIQLDDAAGGGQPRCAKRVQPLLRTGRYDTAGRAAQPRNRRRVAADLRTLSVFSVKTHPGTFASVEGDKGEPHDDGSLWSMPLAILPARRCWRLG